MSNCNTNRYNNHIIADTIAKIDEFEKISKERIEYNKERLRVYTLIKEFQDVINIILLIKSNPSIMKIDIIERFNNVKYPQLQPEPPTRTRLKREIQEGLNESNNKVNKIVYNQQYDIAL